MIPPMIGVGCRALLLMLIASSVAAQSDAEVEAEFSQEEAANLDAAARLLFQAGSEAYSEARFEDALDRFERAYAVSQRSLLLYNIAQTQERLRRDADAIATFERFLDTQPPDEIRAIAERRLQRLRAPSPEETALRVEPEASEEAEPPSTSTGLIVGVTVAAVVAVIAGVIVAVLVTRDDGQVDGTIGNVIRTLRAR